jgi:hypothetical protein
LETVILQEDKEKKEKEKKCTLHIVNQFWRNCPFTQGLAEARGWGRNAHFTLLIRSGETVPLHKD